MTNKLVTSSPLSSPDPLTGGDSDHPDSPQLSFKRIFPHHVRQRYSSKMSTLSDISERESSPAMAAADNGAAAVSQHEALKRPSLLSVLRGSHLSIYVSEGRQYLLVVCTKSYRVKHSIILRMPTLVIRLRPAFSS